MKISGNIVDVFNSRVRPGTILVRKGRIAQIAEGGSPDTWIIPGFVDSHVHVESSLLAPSEFARLAAVHGTVAAVCDPHEIANVLGTGGVEFMLADGGASPFRFCFGAPSCVPATPFETAGASLGPREIETLLKRKDVGFLAEVMNFPGVVNGDPEVMEKIALAKRCGKPVDGHAPGLGGEALRRYIAAGITTDHESLSCAEAGEKLSLGMKLLVREGSAAKDFEELSPLISRYPASCMFCSDDLHPDDLVAGHINEMVKKGRRLGIDIFTLLRCACLNPALHYGLDAGLLRPGDRADFLEVDGLDSLNVLRTFIGGEPVAEHGETLLRPMPVSRVNRFNTGPKRPEDFAVEAAAGGALINVIEAGDGRIATGWAREKPKIAEGRIVSDPGRDILKIAVVNRYADAPPAAGFIRNFGLKRGAIASSVAHDSHNIVAVGVSDRDICSAVNLVIQHKGGLAAAAEDFREVLPLPVAGLMSDWDGGTVAEKYSHLNRLAKGLGSKLGAPFMTLSFMSLLVIPKLKLSDRGLFDAERFRFIGLAAG
jgi:adenine deaminase